MNQARIFARCASKGSGKGRSKRLPLRLFGSIKRMKSCPTAWVGLNPKIVGTYLDQVPKPEEYREVQRTLKNKAEQNHEWSRVQYGCG